MATTTKKPLKSKRNGPSPNLQANLGAHPVGKSENMSSRTNRGRDVGLRVPKPGLRFTDGIRNHLGRFLGHGGDDPGTGDPPTIPSLDPTIPATPAIIPEPRIDFTSLEEIAPDEEARPVMIPHVSEAESPESPEERARRDRAHNILHGGIIKSTHNQGLSRGRPSDKYQIKLAERSRARAKKDFQDQQQLYEHISKTQNINVNVSRESLSRRYLDETPNRYNLWIYRGNACSPMFPEEAAVDRCIRCILENTNVLGTAGRFRLCPHWRQVFHIRDEYNDPVYAYGGSQNCPYCGVVQGTQRTGHLDICPFYLRILSGDQISNPEYYQTGLEHDEDFKALKADPAAFDGKEPMIRGRFPSITPPRDTTQHYSSKPPISRLPKLELRPTVKISTPIDPWGFPWRPDPEIPNVSRKTPVSTPPVEEPLVPKIPDEVEADKLETISDEDKKLNPKHAKSVDVLRSRMLKGAIQAHRVGGIRGKKILENDRRVIDEIFNAVSELQRPFWEHSTYITVSGRDFTGDNDFNQRLPDKVIEMAGSIRPLLDNPDPTITPGGPKYAGPRRVLHKGNEGWFKSIFNRGDEIAYSDWRAGMGTIGSVEAKAPIDKTVPAHPVDFYTKDFLDMVNWYGDTGRMVTDARRQKEEDGAKQRAIDDEKRRRLEEETREKIGERRAEEARKAVEEKERREIEESKRIMEEEAKKREALEADLSKSKAEIEELKKALGDSDLAKVIAELAALKKEKEALEAAKTKVETDLVAKTADADAARKVADAAKKAEDAARKEADEAKEALENTTKTKLDKPEEPKKPEKPKVDGRKDARQKLANDKRLDAIENGSAVPEDVGALLTAALEVKTRPSGSKVTAKTGAAGATWCECATYTGRLGKRKMWHYVRCFRKMKDEGTLGIEGDGSSKSGEATGDDGKSKKDNKSKEGKSKEGTPKGGDSSKDGTDDTREAGGAESMGMYAAKSFKSPRMRKRRLVEVQGDANSTSARPKKLKKLTGESTSEETRSLTGEIPKESCENGSQSDRTLRDDIPGTLDSLTQVTNPSNRSLKRKSSNIAGSSVTALGPVYSEECVSVLFPFPQKNQISSHSTRSNTFIPSKATKETKVTKLLSSKQTFHTLEDETRVEFEERRFQRSLHGRAPNVKLIKEVIQKIYKPNEEEHTCNLFRFDDSEETKLQPIGKKRKAGPQVGHFTSHYS
ncbi:hypothetical protein ABW19_dt0210440 [Dactylella cylindrospora]|nr:hypothetical protein ABW19_dt0210440 [Dactylella cylindrospora]